MWAATVERKHCCSLSYIRTRSGAHTVQFAMHTHAGAWPVVSFEDSCGPHFSQLLVVTFANKWVLSIDLQVAADLTGSLAASCSLTVQ